MRCFIFSLFLLFSTTAFSQVTGVITDEDNRPLSAINIYIEGTFIGTTSNDDGFYSLTVDDREEVKLVFQYLSYETVTREIKATHLPYVLNVQLKKTAHTLDEVQVVSGENPANEIIRQAINRRKINKNKIRFYTADFYSKGNWTIKNAPEKLLGRNIDYQGLDQGLDSTRSGILYLSETVSKIKYEQPDKFHEEVTASKVSGNDQGFSFNTARDAEFSFYDNSIRLNADIVSPLADYAFNYYRFKLVNVEYDEEGKLINKIQVTPKRSNDSSFSGFIYIVEDLWQIYGIELSVNGTAAGIPPVKKITFNQSFRYFSELEFYVKTAQDINFTFELFKTSGSGQFVGVYTNYDFQPSFKKREFTREVMSWTPDAHQKTDEFWEKYRPVPLTDLEREDYLVKDSVVKIRQSKVYLDSIDRQKNKPKVGDLFFGYRYTNSYKNQIAGITSPLLGTHFNTVQGWNLTVRPYFVQRFPKEQTYWQVYSDLSYGFADHRFRLSGGFVRKFNNFSQPILRIEAGVKAQHINDTRPINLVVNDITNLFFERNYLKLYDKKYAEINFTQEVLNGFKVYSKLAGEERTALLNHTDQAVRKDRNGGYTSNNPLLPMDFESLPFLKHRIAKLALGIELNFDQKYYTYPDGKYNDFESKSPTFVLNYEMGLGSSVKQYNFQHLQAELRQTLNLRNKGSLKYQAKSGTFSNAKDLALVDYKHFKGNQFRVATEYDYVGRFNLLPYYQLSTIKPYLEFHAEHNFEGWILGKIPGVNRLNFNLVIGAHALGIRGNKPYQEYSIGLDNIGIGMFRFFRLDYVHSFQGSNYDKGALVFGLQFFNLL